MTTMANDVVLQRENELCRVAVDGRRVDNGERCKLLAIQERTGEWAIYPHGVGKLGVRVTEADAATVAQTILAASTE